MKMTFAERVKYAMNLEGFTQASLAKKVELSQSAIQKITSGKSLRSKKLLDISRALKVRPEWLWDGIEPMKNKWSQSNAIIQKIELDDSHQFICENEPQFPLYSRIERLLIPKNKEKEDDFKMIRLPMDIAKKTNTNATHWVGILAPDTSMPPTIQEGAIVAIDESMIEIKNGKIYAISIGNICMLRILYALPNKKVKIRSLNSDEYPDESLSRDEVIILGKVFYTATMID